MALAAIAESQAASAARLNRIEQSTENSTARLDRIEQLTESNARAIAAHGEELRTSLAAHREELRTSLTAHQEELRTSIADVVSMVGTVAVQRQTEQAAIDRENDTRIEVLLGESRENIKQHEAFREGFDRVLLEIQKIWQRLNSNSSNA
jgi:ABC-type transporter Mla subunit MlaD